MAMMARPTTSAATASALTRNPSRRVNSAYAVSARPRITTLALNMSARKLSASASSARLWYLRAARESRVERHRSIRMLPPITANVHGDVSTSTVTKAIRRTDS